MTNNLNLNKRGDIPITILVIGVMLVCALALFSFFSSIIKIRNNFVGIGLVEQMNSQVEEKVFNNENTAGLYLEKNMSKGILFWKKDVLLFSVEYKNQGS